VRDSGFLDTTRKFKLKQTDGLTENIIFLICVNVQYYNRISDF